VTRRNSDGKKPIVCLMDGAGTLWYRQVQFIEHRFSDCDLEIVCVLDIYQVMERLWSAAPLLPRRRERGGEGIRHCQARAHPAGRCRAGHRRAAPDEHQARPARVEATDTRAGHRLPRGQPPSVLSQKFADKSWRRKPGSHVRPPCTRDRTSPRFMMLFYDSGLVIGFQRGPASAPNRDPPWGSHDAGLQVDDAGSCRPGAACAAEASGASRSGARRPWATPPAGAPPRFLGHERGCHPRSLA
jgi:hypothetical protein